MTTTFVQEGKTLMLAPGADVANGVGYLHGATLFGIALQPVASGVAGPFATEGVFTIAKTSALAIAVGDRLFWDPTGKCVNKTSAAQVCVGVAVSASGNPSPTVQIKLGANTPAAT